MNPLAHDWVFTHTGQRRDGFDEVFFACRACEVSLCVMRAPQFLPRTEDCTPAPSQGEMREGIRRGRTRRFSMDCVFEQVKLVTSE